MNEQESGKHRNQRPNLEKAEQQPLLRALVAEAGRRGDNLTRLAAKLGVTYERLAQWRRGEGDVGNAHTSVHERAADYLGLPTVLVLVLAKKIGLRDFVWPSREALKGRLEIELNRLGQNSFLGGFVPLELASAPEVVQLFVVFLFHEIEARGHGEDLHYAWMHALHLASAGNAQGEQDAASYRARRAEADKIL